MNKIENFKFKFFYADKPESERLMETVYAQVCQQAFENLVNKKSKDIIIKANDNYGTN